jgi:Asp/Glu/hydantoin racemase
MPKLLLINPNTLTTISALLQHHAAQAAGPDVTVHTHTARFGAPYIACEASYAVAAHATLDTWAAALASEPAGFDAVLIACFGDPGLLALREASAVPVTGLAEAAFIEAARLGPFAIVTGGARWQPMLARLAHNLGQGEQLAGILTVEPSGAALASDPPAAQALLRQACLDAVQRFGAQSVILGGAGLAGMAHIIQADLPVPVIDSVQAGVLRALSTAGGLKPTGQPFDFPWIKLSPELTALGAAPAPKSPP